MVLHDLIHSSRVHRDFVAGAQVSFLLASRSASNSSFFFSSGVLHFFVLLSYPIISVCGGLSLYDLEMLPIRPQQVHSFVVHFLNNSVQPFLLSYFHSILSILPEALRCSSHQASFYLVKFRFYSSMFQPKCCLNPFSLIRFLSRSNRSAFRVYRVLVSI